MTTPVIFAITPEHEGVQTVRGNTRFLFGGPRYRAIADEILESVGDLRHLDLDAWDASLPEADALVITPWFGMSPNEVPPFDAELLGQAPGLRVIAGTFDFRLGWIDLDEVSRRGIVLVDTSRTMTPTVAEFGVGITLALLRDIPAAIDAVREGGWTSTPTGVGYVFRDLADCRVGLAGFGTINRHYRRFIAPYGAEVTVYDPFVDDEVAAAHGVARAGSLVELARGCDVFVVAIPPTPATLGVIDASVIDALAPGSLFVLLSRMAVVEQEALWRRASAEELRVAVDVYDPEPPPADAWFRRAPNVLPTPHIAGNVAFAHERCFAEACEDVVRVLRGEAPMNPATDRDKLLYAGKLEPSSGAEPA